MYCSFYLIVKINIVNVFLGIIDTENKKFVFIYSDYFYLKPFSFINNLEYFRKDGSLETQTEKMFGWHFNHRLQTHYHYDSNFLPTVKE